MFLLPSLVLATSSILLLWLTWRRLEAGGFAVLPLAGLLFVLLNSLGLALLPYTGLYLPFLAETIVVYDRNDILAAVIYTRQVAAHLLVHLFFFLAIFLRFPNGAQRKARSGFNGFRRTPWAGPLLVFSLLFSFYFYYRYFLLGPGLSLLEDVQIVFASPVEAVAARSLAAQQVELGEGAFGASIGAYILFPFLTAMAALFVRSQIGFWLVFCFSAVMSIGYVVQTYQKAPIAAVILVYLGLLLLRATRVGGLSMYKQQAKSVLLILAAAVSLGVGLYVVNFGLYLEDAVRAFWGRVFLVPANTEGFWFLVYPDLHRFLGLPAALNTNMEIIRTTAFLATGDVFSANASFVAVGWAGAGYIGVMLAGLLLITYLVALDALLNRLPAPLRIVSLFLILPAMLFLVSGTFFDFLFKGGLTPFLLALAVRGVSIPSGVRQP